MIRKRIGAFVFKDMNLILEDKGTAFLRNIGSLSCKGRGSEPKKSNPQNLFNPLNAEFNPICPLLDLLKAHHILHVSR
jgi:hypothetical protein